MKASGTELLGSKWRRQLEAEKVPEWMDHYIDVDAITRAAVSGYGTAAPEEQSPGRSTSKLKGVLERCLQAQGPRVALTAEDGLVRRRMLQSFEEEVKKANAWAEHQLSQASAKLEMVEPYKEEYSNLMVKDKQILRTAVIQIFTALRLLENFCSLNCIIFHQIGKALHPEQNTHVLWIVKTAQEPPAFIRIMTNELQPKIVKTCRCFAQMEGVTVAAAQEQLQAKLSAPLPSFAEGLHLGLNAGMAIPLLIADTYIFLLPHPGNMDQLYANLPIFRGTAVIVFVMWFWGFCALIMDTLHINYGFILDLDPATRLHWKQTVDFAAFWTNLWLWTHFIFSFQAKLGLFLIPESIVPNSLLPSLFFLFATALFLCPFDCVYRPTRWWILRQVRDVMCSPLLPVTFASNFVGDYLTSIVKVLIDVNYSACFILSGSWRTSAFGTCSGGYSAFLLTLLPLNFRLLQCLRRYHDDPRSPHLWNFGKYLTSLVAVLIGAWNPRLADRNAGWPLPRVLYILLLIASTLYSWIWDVFVDWALYYRKPDGSWVARPLPITGRTLLPTLDLVGRCAWAYTIVVDPPGERFGVATLVFFTAIVEVLRRSMWAVVRLANEHYFNASNYRAVKEVPLSQLGLHPSPSEDRRGLSDLIGWLAQKPSSPLSTTIWGPPTPQAKSPTPPPVTTLTTAN